MSIASTYAARSRCLALILSLILENRYSTVIRNPSPQGSSRSLQVMNDRPCNARRISYSAVICRKQNSRPRCWQWS
jgi:hypothetical protein